MNGKGWISWDRASFLLLALGTILAWSSTASAATYSGGSGTEADPYLISSSADLLTLSATSADWGQQFLMTHTIDMTGITTFTPIGGKDSDTFSGVFDGGGHIVKNLAINLPAKENVGVFGRVSGGTAAVKNLGLQGGVIAGLNRVGGLIGWNEGGSVTSCYSTGAVTGSSFVGGLVGSMQEGSMTACYATGAITGNDCIGGLVGLMGVGGMTACYATGAVTGNDSIGGLCGTGDSVTASFWDTQTSGLSTGLFGTGLNTAQMKSRSYYQDAGWAPYDWVMTNGEYPRLAWEGTAGSSFTALFSGSGSESDPCLVSTPSDLVSLSKGQGYWRKCISMTADIDMMGVASFSPIGNEHAPFGGLFDGGGHAVENLTINQPMQVEGVGLFGRISDNAQLRNLGVKDGTVTGHTTVGGLVGFCSGTVMACYSTATVTGDIHVGGLIGFCDNGTVTGCYSTSAVTGGDLVGGLVGYSGACWVTACYASGPVTGQGVIANIGGLVGACTNSVVVSCYAMSTVQGNGDVGGLIGGNSNGIVKASFWDMERSQWPGSSAGKGLTTAQMKSLKILRNAGWNASPDWVMTDGQYPRLAWEATGMPAIPAPEPVPLTGSGTAGDPYRVGTPAEFAQLSWHTAILDAHILLTKDVDLAGMTLYPIGDLGPFTGVFDGANHRLSNAFLEYPDTDYVGVFCVIGEAGVIQDLGVVDHVISGRYSSGGLAGWNCGGMVSSCYATGAVTGARYVGGLVGWVEGGAVISCYATGTVTGEAWAGGLVGRAEWGTVTFCFATGAVSGDTNLGGLIGLNDYFNTVTSCYATGAVVGGHVLGGLVGFNRNSTVTRCYATGALSGTGSCVGGLIGEDDTGTVTSCFATGAVTGNENVGGLTGANSVNGSFSTVTSCYATGAVTGARLVGGLIGGNFSLSTVTFCFATGAVSGDTNLGGLIGLNDGTVTSSFWDSTTGGPDNGIGTGRSTAQMKQRATFETAGWDFSGSPPVWSMVEGQTYPRLFGIPIPVDSILALQALASGGDGSFFLTQDLDARETATWSKSGHPGFLPIGTVSQPFNGTLDGRGHRIYGLHISRPSSEAVGLFGCLGPSGVVRGVGLEQADVTGGDYTAGLVGVNAGSVEQCYVQGRVTGENSTGGLVGQNAGSLAESYAVVTLTGGTPGGLVGADSGGSVSRSFWDMTVSGTSFSAGGTGLSASDMMNIATYANAGWDFASTWAVMEGLSYPFFQNSLLLRVMTSPPRLINADSVDIEVETFVPNLFVTVGGGAYPAYRKFTTASQAAITVSLRQEALNRLVVSALSETGVETVVARYDVYESSQFPSAPTPVTGITLEPSSVSLAANTTQQFACIAAFSDGTTGDVTPVANWNVSLGTISAAGLYTHSGGTATVQALLHTDSGWQYSNMATINTGKSGTEPKSGTGLVQGVVCSNYTGLGLATGKVTAYGLFNPLAAGQYPVYDTLGNYSFFLPEGKYHFEGSCSGHRSEISWGGRLLESRRLIDPGPPAQYTELYYSGQIKDGRPLSYDFSLRPNDSGAPWVVFIEPVADTTVNTERIVVTAIDADQYSELEVAKYTHNTVDHDIPNKISSTGFYRDTWPLKLGLNVLHLYTMDTEGNASERTIQITYDPNYTGPGADSDGDGLPNEWETAHGLDPGSAAGVNGADGDLDGDNLTNIEEYQRGTLPNATRSDADSLDDGVEAARGTNPLAADTDGDGINDDVEIQLGSDPLRDDRIRMAIVNLADGAAVRGDAVTLLADVLPGYNLGAVASVSIEVRGVGTGGAWRVVGTASAVPFAATWDTTGLSEGAYQVRAVATSRIGCVDGAPAAVAVTLSPSATYFERIESGAHVLSAPVASASDTVLALRSGSRFARITIPAGALATDDTVTAFFPDASGFTPTLSTFQQDAGLYLDIHLASHTGDFLNGTRATVEVGYPDADRDDHLDDTNLRVPLLSVDYLPTPASAFVALVSPRIDRRLGCVIAETPHFSVFGVIEEQPAPPLNLMTDSLPQGTVGVAYSVVLDANGGAQPYTWTVASGALPDGVSIVGNSLEGTPTTAGSFVFTLRVSDTQSTPHSAEQSYTVEIFAANQPSVTVTREAGQAGIVNALPARWDIVFSEPVTGFETADVTLTGTAAYGAGFAVTGSGAAYTLEVTSLARDGRLHPFVASGKAVSIANSASNRASSNEEEVWMDRRKPQVLIIGNYSGLQEYDSSRPLTVKTLPVMFTLTFDEPVAGLAAAGITFTGLDPQPGFDVQGTGKDYTVLVTAVGAGVTLFPTVTANAAVDSAGNGNDATTYTGRAIQYVPDTRPTVTINQAASQPDPARAFPIVYDIVFSEPVTGFTTGDVAYAGTAPNPQYSVTGNGATYTLTVTGASGDGRIAFCIPEDVVTETNAASVSTDNVVTFDATPPQITIGQPSTTKTRQGPVSFPVHYAGASAIALSASDITLEGMPTAQVSVTGTGIQTRVVTLSGISGTGSLGFSIAPGTATDAAGNSALAAGPSAAFDVDPRLTVTVNQSPTQRDPTNHAPIFFDVSFNDSVTGFDASDVTMGGTATGLVYDVDGSGNAYTIEVTDVSGKGTVQPSLAADVCQGAWGGSNVASTSTDNTVTYDPTIALALFSATPSSGHAPLTVQFIDESILGTLPIETWNWDFGDGTTSDEQYPEHVYQNQGTYTVTLTVTTASGADQFSRHDYIQTWVGMPVTGWPALAIAAAALALHGARTLRGSATRKARSNGRNN